MTKTRITPLYKRISCDDEPRVRVIPSATKRGVVKDIFVAHKLQKAISIIGTNIIFVS